MRHWYLTDRKNSFTRYLGKAERECEVSASAKVAALTHGATGAGVIISARVKVQGAWTAIAEGRA